MIAREWTLVGKYSKANNLRPQYRLVGGIFVFLDSENKEVRVSANTMNEELKRLAEATRKAKKK